MHRTHLKEILHDAAVAHAIRPTIERGGLTFAQNAGRLDRPQCSAARDGSGHCLPEFRPVTASKLLRLIPDAPPAP